ncbi:hypothetical protein [Bradyrhizobium sp. SZCCHNR3003]|uniref:hypothetical protein n=1 Tax=Bradyrhizobium sp. SZCCHNR3003 TaxID=3057387 RepID=UPI002915CEA1|nr:hypothetical protein [Bradyrhizobium sp. SZCCHNR3003]
MASYLKDVMKKGPSGFSSSKADLKFWADRAESNSETAPRAKDGAIKLPPTCGQPKLRSTSSPPRGFDGSDPYKRAKEDLNYKGSGRSYLPNVRRR